MRRGMKVHVVFDVPDAATLDEAMVKLKFVMSSEGVGAIMYTPPDGTRIEFYSGVNYEWTGFTTEADRYMAAKRLRDVAE